jgi:hypothetical protein
MRRVDIILQKFFARGLVIPLALLLLQLPNYAMGQQTTVATYNLFIGAEIQSLASSPDIGAFLVGAKDALDQIVENDFTDRAEALAALIIEKDLQLIGLQEVYVFTSPDPLLNGSPPFLDYLEELKDALSEQGACYDDVATVTNFDFDTGPISVPFYGPVRITDRDVILARCDVNTVPVDVKSKCSRPSIVPTDDGCTYLQTASTVIPGGGVFPDIPIDFKRGYVAVDVIGSFPLRFFNTHLEVRLPDPSEPLSALIQSAQAAELIELLNALGPATGPVIVAGDINSSPEDEIFDIAPGVTKFPPYTQFALAGYSDAWTLRPGKPKGFTCCFGEDLSMPADLYERIDVIFSDVTPNQVKANVLGNDEADQTPSGLWPSDHAGVASRMWF